LGDLVEELVFEELVPEEWEEGVAVAGHLDSWKREEGKDKRGKYTGGGETSFLGCLTCKQ